MTEISLQFFQLVAEVVPVDIQLRELIHHIGDVIDFLVVQMDVEIPGHIDDDIPNLLWRIGFFIGDLLFDPCS